MLKKLVAEPRQTYDGRQLAPHWIYRQHDLLGDAIVGFRGPCDVKITEMVDIEDVKADAPIFSRDMVHFYCRVFRSRSGKDGLSATSFDCNG